MAGLSRLGVGLGSVLEDVELAGGMEDSDDDGEGGGMETTIAQDFADITEVSYSQSLKS